MPADVQELFEEAKCYACQGVSEAQALTLALEARWLLSLNPAADVTRQHLLSQANCFACYTGSMFDLMELALLDAISTA